MRRLVLGTGLALIAVLAGCQGPPPGPPRSAAPEPAVLATQALQSGDYARAAALFREALKQDPRRPAVHYGLAVAASYLSLKDEAAREFRWVARYGPAGSPEVEEARRWLIRAGLWRPPQVQPVRRVEEERKPGHATLEGRAIFGDSGQPPRPLQRLQLFLVGQPDSPTQKERYNLRTDEDGRFRFPSVVPGPYKLTNRVAGQPIWRLRVELKPSEGARLDLTPANSVAVRDDFPESG
ncbi:MAG: tetratricopeptide repeat protein [Candidatus Rokuibacteriota bacterium]